MTERYRTRITRRLINGDSSDLDAPPGKAASLLCRHSPTGARRADDGKNRESRNGGADNTPTVESSLGYIGYATTSQIRTHIKLAFVVWLVMTTVSILFAMGLDAVSAATEPITKWLPNWLWTTVLGCALLWAFRGRTITMPRMTFTEWAIASVLVVVTGFVDTTTPAWAAVSWTCAVTCGVGVVDSLAQKGLENYRHLHPAGESLRRGPDLADDPLREVFEDAEGED